MARVATIYQTDIGYDYYVIPLNFSQTVSNDSITNIDALDLVPQSILEKTQVIEKDYCPKPRGVILRRLEIVRTDKTEYRFDIPFRPNQDDWLALIEEVQNRTDITKYRFFGEKITDDVLTLLMGKFL